MNNFCLSPGRMSSRTDCRPARTARGLRCSPRAGGRARPGCPSGATAAGCAASSPCPPYRARDTSPSCCQCLNACALRRPQGSPRGSWPASPPDLPPAPAGPKTNQTCAAPARASPAPASLRALRSVRRCWIFCCCWCCLHCVRRCCSFLWSWLCSCCSSCRKSRRSCACCSAWPRSVSAGLSPGSRSRPGCCSPRALPAPRPAPSAAPASCGFPRAPNGFLPFLLTSSKKIRRRFPRRLSGVYDAASCCALYWIC